jgi:hypothetical protein
VLVTKTPLFCVREPGLAGTQFIRSSGILETKYSRCSFNIVHIGRFFWFISSSRFLSSFSKLANHVSSQSHTSGLSAKYKNKKLLIYHLLHTVRVPRGSTHHNLFNVIDSINFHACTVQFMMRKFLFILFAKHLTIQRELISF